MINLLQFNQPDGPEHYARYAREVQPHLEGYADVHEHRAAALERTELIATSAWGIGP